MRSHELRLEILQFIKEEKFTEKFQNFLKNELHLNMNCYVYTVKANTFSYEDHTPKKLLYEMSFVLITGEGENSEDIANVNIRVYEKDKKVKVDYLLTNYVKNGDFLYASTDFVLDFMLDLKHDFDILKRLHNEYKQRLESFIFSSKLEKLLFLEKALEEEEIRDKENKENL